MFSRAAKTSAVMASIVPVPDDKPQEAASDITLEPPIAATASDLRTIFLGGLFLIVLLAALHTAREIMMPVVLAFVLKLVLQPLLRSLQKFHLPQTLASIIILGVLVSGVMGLGTALSGPITSWAEKIPDSIPKLQKRIGFLSHPIAATQKFVVHAEDLTKVDDSKVLPVAVQGTRLSDKIFSSTRNMIAGLFTTILILFFLLVSGDTFLRRLVEVLPRFKDKRRAVDISQQIEQDISKYLLTITMMNVAVGAATAIVVQVTGLGDPVLWGTLAFLLNYVPIVGPLVCAGILLFAGLMTDMDGASLLPASLYLLIHILEGSLITPLLIAKRFTLNPVLVVLSLVFWYWMWGIAGAILAMPMLAITKIICDRIHPLMPFGHFLEG